MQNLQHWAHGAARQPEPSPAGNAAGLQLSVAWARSDEQVQQAQRLRHQVFVQEMGARPQVPLGTPAGLDVDTFDAHCEHLLVLASDTRHRIGRPRVVGTYRVLTPAGAVRAGGLYTETEFDLEPLQALRPGMVELGRSCVDPAFRQGAVIMLLWSSLANFMHDNGLRWMIGCASVPMSDGGHLASGLWHKLAQRHLAPEPLRVKPRLALPVDELSGHPDPEAPALIKGYLRCGAQLLGPPAWDPDFGTADLPLMLDLQDMRSAYRRHFIGR